MDKTDEVVVALITSPPDSADRIATALVESGRAACVNIVPRVRSIYRWQGDVEREEEALLIVKTRRSSIDAMRSDLSGIHPYENFELLAFDVVAGNPAYLAWVTESTAG
jgi:periplasmic divalent cation tolerance protein